MLESNPSRNSQLETQPNDEQGAGLLVGASIVWIDFPCLLKLIQRSRREAASAILGCTLKKYHSRMRYKRRSAVPPTWNMARFGCGIFVFADPFFLLRPSRGGFCGVSGIASPPRV